MPETDNRVDIGKLEVQMDEVKKDVTTLTGKVDTLSGNIQTALTEMKVSQAKFESTTEKVNRIDSEVSCIKHDHIEPLTTEQNKIAFQCKIMKYVATAFFIGLVYALADKFIAMI